MAASGSIEYKVPCKSLTKPDDIHNVVVRKYSASSKAKSRQRFPVLLVHALTRQSGDFECLRETLVTAGFEVAAWDVVGRGDSDYAIHASDYGYPQVR
jgi:alpha-beta hydrolase superfamily lysophospholipase